MAGACNLPFSDSESPQSDVAALGPEERWLSAAAGACLVGYGLSRMSLRSLAAMAVGGFLVYRGSIGRCPLSERLASSGCGLRASGGNGAEQGRTGGDHYTGEPTGAVEESLAEVDPIDEAAMESFPASDPPSYTGRTATPSHPII